MEQKGPERSGLEPEHEWGTREVIEPGSVRNITLPSRNRDGAIRSAAGVEDGLGDPSGIV